MLEIKGLVKRFGSFTAVDGLDMKVEKGSVFETLPFSLFSGYSEKCTDFEFSTKRKYCM